MMGRPSRNRKPKVDVHVTLEAPLMAALKIYCEDEGLSISYMIGRCLKDHLFEYLSPVDNIEKAQL